LTDCTGPAETDRDGDGSLLVAARHRRECCYGRLAAPRDVHAEAAAMQIKTGAWRRDLAGLQQRRLEAARMFACGATQAEVARTFAVSRQAAS
jgi:hypothetical protein